MQYKNIFNLKKTIAKSRKPFNMALCFIFSGAILGMVACCNNKGNDYIPNGKVADEKFSFAWISDNHLGSFAYAEDDLVQAIEDINTMDSIEFVIFTGDLTEFGVTSEFALLKEKLAALNKPYFMVDGNHDVNWSENGTTSFEKFFKGNAPRFCFDAHGIRFIGCGSGPMLRMGAPHIPREELNWVKRVLDTTNINQPIIFVNHFPQFEEIANSYELTNIIKEHNVQYILCGHFHVNSTKEYNGLTSILGRSLLRRTDPMGGYNIVTVTPDSIFAAERTVKGETHPVWFRGELQEMYTHKGEQMEISYAINGEYPQVEELWRIDEVSDIASQGSLDGELYVYTTTGGKTVALNASTGKKIWEFQTGNKIFSAPFITVENIYVTSTDGFIYALKRKNGKLLWKYDTGYPVVACPLVVGDTLYTGSSNEKFYAIDALEGKLHWVSEGFTGYMESRPCADSENIYTGGWEGRFWAINRLSGGKVWEYNIGKGRYFSPGACWPIIAKGHIFVQSSDKVLRGYTPDGSIAWENTSAVGRESIGISKDGNTLYVKGTEDTFTAFDLTADGFPVKWETKMPYTFNFIPTAPVEIPEKNTVLAADTYGTICAIGSGGEGLLWQYKISNCAVTSFCATEDGNMIAMTMDGKIVKLKF